MEVHHNTPIRYSTSVALNCSGQKIVEKGWNYLKDMQTGQVYFHRNLVPQTISHFNTTSLVLGPPSIGAETREDNCLVRVLDWTRPAYTKPFELLQAGPAIKFTLCNRGECVPDIHNTVYVSLVHRLFSGGEKFYERRIVTMNTTAPFDYISVSKPIFFHGVLESQVIYSSSMAVMARSLRIRQDRRPAHAAKPVQLYVPGRPEYSFSSLFPDNTSYYELSHAYLNDEILIAFGIDDKDGGWIDCSAKEIINDHIMC